MPPRRKQVFRFASDDRSFSGDIIGFYDETFPRGEPLLVPVMHQGRRIEGSAADRRQRGGSKAARRIEGSAPDPATAARSARQRFLAARGRFPARILALGPADPRFLVSDSPRLEERCEPLRKTFVGPTPS